MKWILVAGAAGTLLVFALAFALTSGGPAPERAAPAPAPAPAEPVFHAPAPSAPAARTVQPRSEVVEPEPAPEAPSAKPTSPEELLRQLAPLRNEVEAGLADLSPRVAHCGAFSDGLVLTLEALHGVVRIARVDAGTHPEAPDAEAGAGRAPDEDQVRCVRSALEGNSLAAPSAKPGRRWDMPWWPGLAP
jgi:hypothetical protein